ncbi:MAG: hypothetical protein JWQ44_1297 [Chthoniobacter sp.]|nr:hypothetical protein [Chthoniobacter sp.]
MPFPRTLPFFLLAVAASSLAAAPLDFSRDVQPLLSENCYHCHGPDEKARKARLRLDTREGAFGKTEDGIAVVAPGNSAGSELVTRIFSTDPDEVMPSPKSHRTLSEPQKQLLKRWVDEGAPWAEHWSFVTPKRPEVPTVGEPGRGPIDAFVRARLDHEKLSPSPEAPKEKLIRRVTLDLTGLPPTLEEIDAFLGDTGADAYDRVVDRLLASPRYGERMVWDWLDAARYADTNGFQGDPVRTMWPWRDWAVKAFNTNMPFDQFTIEQLAGDLLPNATRDQRLATGFNRNHMVNNEGGTIPEENRVSYVVDRVDTTATVWLGLTVGCARCHDHKFDPISQREYYQLYSYFNQLPEGGLADAFPMAKPVMSLATPEEEQRIAELQMKADAARQRRDETVKQLTARQPEWERETLAGLAQTGEPQWTVIEPGELFSEKGATLTKQPDHSVIVSGANPATDDYVITAPGRMRGITAFKIEALPDASFVNGGPGRAENGNFALTELKIQGDGKPVELAVISATFEQKGWSAAQAIDGKAETGWAVQPEFGKEHVAIFEARSPVGYGGDPLLSIRLEHRSPNLQHTLGRFRVSVTNASPALLRPMPDDIRSTLATAADQRTPEQKKKLSEFHLAASTERAAAQKDADETKKAVEEANKAVLKVMVMEDAAKPRENFILTRGEYDQHGEKVAPGTPHVLPSLPADATSNRLALARWLVTPDHPLTARVTVNRFWAMFFGTGLVKTVEDFGLQGEKPSHPELLDWLALEFIETGWNVKRLVRTIVTSATYRQSSAVSPALLERDPENRLLARAPRHRWPSWMLRDQALAAAGLLVEKPGGAPVKGYQPDGVWEEATFGQIKYAQDHGDALYRRSLYTFWRRIVGPTMFFDSSARQTCTVRASQTNTPLHALTTLNDVTFVEAARALAERVLKQSGPGDSERLVYAFRLCTGRMPTEREAELLSVTLQRLRSQFGADAKGAQQLIAAGESKPDAQLDPAELASHAAFASLLLNLDETLSKE